MTDSAAGWKSICSADELLPMVGVRALFDGDQVAIFKINDELYAVNAIDPFSQAAVLSRGIVGDLNGTVVVASPIHKQHFCLKTGVCLEDVDVAIKTYRVRENEGAIELAEAL